ncbi:MAG TPA: hypothetical protein VK914_04030 [bacterium]|nr:hypothetical protein [bacterium]
MDTSDFFAATRHYCAEELKQGWVFLSAGLGLSLAGAWMWKSQSAFRHALWPLLAVAVLQLAVGGTSLMRAPARIQEAQTRLASDGAGFKADETRRLAKALDAFRFYKLAAIAGILAAIGLALFLSQNAVARGWALGLLVQSALMLAADLVAEQRAEAYLDLLRRL